MTHVLIVLLAMAFGYAIWRHHALKATCRYCGERWGHDVHCPYKDIL